MHDYGAGRVAYLYRINMKGDYKLVGGNAKGEAFVGAAFEGSNDLIDWTILYNVTDPVKSTGAEWIPDLKKPTKFYHLGFRYYRVRHNSKSNCRFAEIFYSGSIQDLT